MTGKAPSKSGLSLLKLPTDCVGSCVKLAENEAEEVAKDLVQTAVDGLTGKKSTTRKRKAPASSTPSDVIESVLTPPAASASAAVADPPATPPPAKKRSSSKKNIAASSDSAVLVSPGDAEKLKTAGVYAVNLQESASATPSAAGSTPPTLKKRTSSSSGSESLKVKVEKLSERLEALEKKVGLSSDYLSPSVSDAK
jgi:hypothetical protein